MRAAGSATGEPVEFRWRSRNVYSILALLTKSQEIRIEWRAFSRERKQWKRKMREGDLRRQKEERVGWWGGCGRIFKKESPPCAQPAFLPGKPKKSWPGSAAEEPAGSKWRGKLGPRRFFSPLPQIFALRAVSPPSGSTQRGIVCAEIKR